MDLSMFSGLLNISADWVVLGVITLLFAFDVWRSGSSRVCAIAFALPIAMLLMFLLPKTALIGGLSAELEGGAMGALIFAILCAGLYILMRRIDFGYGGEIGRPIQSVIIGFAGAVILMVVWLEVPALASLWQLSESATVVFGEAYRFWLLLGSYATLAFVSR